MELIEYDFYIAEEALDKEREKEDKSIDPTRADSLVIWNQLILLQYNYSKEVRDTTTDDSSVDELIEYLERKAEKSLELGQMLAQIAMSEIDPMLHQLLKDFAHYHSELAANLELRATWIKNIPSDDDEGSFISDFIGGAVKGAVFGWKRALFDEFGSDGLSNEEQVSEIEINSLLQNSVVLNNKFDILIAQQMGLLSYFVDKWNWVLDVIDEEEEEEEENLGVCPNGHGDLKLWEGKPRCWTCGYEP